MKTFNTFSYLFTGLAVKTYMMIAIVWSKSSELNTNFKQVVRETFAIKAAKPIGTKI